MPANSIISPIPNQLSLSKHPYFNLYQKNHNYHKPVSSVELVEFDQQCQADTKNSALQAFL